MMLIGIHGLAGSGKDTLADWFVAERGFVKLSFADAMKNFCLSVFKDIDPKYLFGPSKLRSSMVRTELAPLWGLTAYEFASRLTGENSRAYDRLKSWVCSMHARGVVPVREMLQTLGSEWGRSVDPLIWVKNLYQNELPREVAPSTWGWNSEWGFPPAVVQGVVVPDHRFENEVRYTQSIGGYVIKLRRSQELRGEIVGGVKGHASEAGVADSVCNLVLDATEGLHKVRFLQEAVWERFLRRLPTTPLKIGTQGT